MSHETIQLRKLLANAGYDSATPLPEGLEYRMYEGKATGHGRLRYGDPIPGPVVSLAGMIPAEILYERRGHLDHVITDGVISSPSFFWDGVAGGWSTVTSTE